MFWRRKKTKLIETPNGEVITDEELERLRKIEEKYYNLKREANSLLMDIDMDGPIEIVISKRTLKSMVAESLQGAKYHLLSGKVSKMTGTDNFKEQVVNDLFDYLNDERGSGLKVKIVLKE